MKRHEKMDYRTLLATLRRDNEVISLELFDGDVLPKVTIIDLVFDAELGERDEITVRNRARVARTVQWRDVVSIQLVLWDKRSQPIDLEERTNELVGRLLFLGLGAD